MKKTPVFYTRIYHAGKTHMQEVQETEVEYSDLTTAKVLIRSLELASSWALIFTMVQIFGKTNKSLSVLGCFLWSTQKKNVILKNYELDNLEINLALYDRFLF